VRKVLALAIIALVLLPALGYASSEPTPSPRVASGTIRFAVIGDFGRDGADELAVANLVKGWNPDFIITTGDNNWPDGAAAIDANIGQYYSDYIYLYSGAYSSTATANRFFPTLGNHDWVTPNAQPYLDYFVLPGNERYYDFVWAPIHFFAIDSDPNEPDGRTGASTQATWLRNQLAASTSCWNLVYFHHAPYSSGSHGSDTTMQWSFRQWDANAVLAGHDHDYERVLVDGFPYFVVGLGGVSIREFGTPIAGSQVRYADNYGAMRVTASPTALTYEFIAIDGTVVDTYTQNGGCILYLPLVLK
jgi:tartrate-resistant acid phosphatase type 5